MMTLFDGSIPSRASGSVLPYHPAYTFIDCFFGFNFATSGAAT